MTVFKLREQLDDLVNDGLGNSRVYVYSDNDPQDAELMALEAREVVPFKPFWTTVDGFLIK